MLPPLSTPNEIHYAVATDIGPVRSQNQDSQFIRVWPAGPPWSLAAAVFDGVGGRPNGAEGSRRAARYLEQALEAQTTPGDDVGTAGRLLQAVHRRLFEDIEHDPTLAGMSTTATLLLVPLREPLQLWAANVGDGSAYRLRNGNLERLTQSDSVVEELIRQGLLSEGEARAHPRRHVITQALGIRRDVRPHLAVHALIQGDRLLLCTDGLTDVVPRPRIEQLMQLSDLQFAAGELIREARQNAGTDNVTVVVVEFAPRANS